MKTNRLLQSLNCWKELKSTLPIALSVLLFSLTFQVQQASATGSNTCNNVTGGGTIAGDESKCCAFDPACIDNVTYPCGGSGTLEYKWLKSTDNFSTSSVISGANSSSYNPGTITQTTWYKRLSKRSCCSDWVGCSNVVVKRVNTPPNVSITPNGSTSICQGGSVELCASAGSCYLWSNGKTTRCITVNCAGRYTVTVTDANGCKGTACKDVSVSSNPSCSISGCNEICQGQTTTLCAPNSCSSYLWSTGATTRCINVCVAGCYTVTVTNSNGCTSTCSRTVKVNALPVCTISGGNSICYGGSTTLSGPESCSSYLWNTGATTRCITVNCAGTYYLTVTNNKGCSSTCSKCVTLNPIPSCSISGNCELCPGQSTTLCAPASCSSYLWNTGATSRCINVCVAGSYTVTVTNSSGCKSTCSKTVNVNPLPECTITGCSSFCYGGSTTLSGPESCSSYLWSTGATTRCITVTCAGTYSLTVTNHNGCTSTCSKCVTVNPLPNCHISGDNTICHGQSTTLSAPESCSSYLWSTGATTRCITITCGGTYTVTVTNSDGCSSTCSKCVSESPAPNCCISGNTTIRHGQCTILSAPWGCNSYLWSNGATTRCIWVSCAGNYCVTVTNSNGCSSTCCVTVNWYTYSCRTASSTAGEEAEADKAMDNFGSIDALVYPNPFNSKTTFQFENKGDKANAVVEIFSIDGARVTELYNNEAESNQVNKVEWNAEGLPIGVYMYRISCGEDVVTGRLIYKK